MVETSINAYNLPQRVASYDANMEVMHPNRSKMTEIALEMLPFSSEAPLKALDLGIGTGYFTKQFLGRFPNSSIVAVDGAKAMAELATTRLGRLASQVEIHIADFRRIDQLGLPANGFDVVFSSFALHHLNREEKQAVVAYVLQLLRPGGWFLNADLIVADSSLMHNRFQQLRIQGILGRADRNDPRFCDAATLQAFIEELERQDGDQPQTLLDDLQILRNAGLKDAALLWLEYREAVFGGPTRRRIVIFPFLDEENMRFVGWNKQTIILKELWWRKRIQK